MASHGSIAGAAPVRAHAGVSRRAEPSGETRARATGEVAARDAHRRTERAGVAAEDRAVLAWPYVGILLVETGALAGLAAAAHGRPPWSYELGWAGCASMLVMQLYSVRRRVRALRRLGSLRGWLDLHVFLGLQGFVMVAYHSVGASPSASLAAINFALVATVVLTGVIGRYLYSLIPRARASDERAYAALDPRLVQRVAPPRECRGLVDLIRMDLERRRRLRRLLRHPAVTAPRARALRRSIALAFRISAFDVADRWFSRWTLLHRPLAVLLLATTALHALAHFAYVA
jgi:hypothetical protein